MVKERVSSRAFWTIDNLFAEQSDMVYRSNVQTGKRVEYVNVICLGFKCDISFLTYLLFPRHTSLIIQPKTSGERDSVRFDKLPISHDIRHSC